VALDQADQVGAAAAVGEAHGGVAPVAHTGEDSARGEDPQAILQEAAAVAGSVPEEEESLDCSEVCFQTGILVPFLVVIHKLGVVADQAGCIAGKGENFGCAV